MTTTRDPDETRRSLLKAAFNEIYESGFRAASIDRILSSTGVTKGALYHHFKGKTDLGYAVVDEVMGSHVLENWVKPLARPGDAIALVKLTMDRNAQRAAESGNFAKGCPLNNLSVEMSQIDEGFRVRIETVFNMWRDALANALRRGQKNGSLRPDFDPDQIGLFVLASLEGIASMAKNTRTPDQVQGLLGPLYDYLDGLRQPTTKAA